MTRRVRVQLQNALLVEQSRSLSDELRDEYRRMLVRVERDRDQAKRLRDLAEQAADRVAADERLMRSMAEVLGLSAQATIDELGGALRGARLREVAVDVLRKHLRPGEDVHYRDWFALLATEGVAVAGKDPLATFLAQISRAESVQAVGKRTGRYRLLRAA